jgi:hypothetical protein
MKKNPLQLLAALLALCVVCSRCTPAVAGPAPGALLTQAYVALASADHDYKGHRADAMKQVEAAAKEIGVSVKGDGRNHEKQGVSDEQLRIASNLLKEARAGLSGKALKRADKALHQISLALSIK